MSSTPRSLLTAWIARHATRDAAAAAGLAWFEGALATLAGPHRERDLYLAVGLAPRKLGKAPLALTAEDAAAAEAARPGWRPQILSVDEAARLALLLTAAEQEATASGPEGEVGGPGEAFLAAFDALWRTADVGEQVAFYKGLPLYPAPERHLWRATDGCRTSIRLVFEAIAHHNPYPAERFDETAFNQLCLKALFVGTTLHPIVGIDGRANPRLARMMTDYAFERWAAKRPVSPELWRCVGPAADARGLLALSRALVEPDAPTRAAAALACAHSALPEARALLTLAPEPAAAIERGALSWDTLADFTG